LNQQINKKSPINLLKRKNREKDSHAPPLENLGVHTHYGCYLKKQEEFFSLRTRLESKLFLSIP